MDYVKAFEDAFPFEREAEREARMRKLERDKTLEHIRRMRLLFGERAGKRAAKAAARELRNIAKG
jgi:hypothetical protein